MPPSITAADNQDGTGVTVTISGTTGTNTLYSQSVSTPSEGWVSRGTRSGDGTIVAAVVGFHWFHVIESAVSSPSNVVIQTGTLSAASLHYRCMTSAQSIVNMLTLTGLSTVVLRRFPWVRAEEEANKPMVIIAHPGSETMRPNEGTNQRDDVGYPVLVAVYDRDAQANDSDLDKYLLWRQQLARSFRHNTELPALPEITRTIVEPGRIVEPAEYVNGVLYSPLLVRFISREPRGVGA